MRDPSKGSLSAAAAATQLRRCLTLIVRNKHRPFRFDASLRLVHQKNNKKKVSAEIKSGVCQEWKRVGQGGDCGVSLGSGCL